MKKIITLLLLGLGCVSAFNASAQAPEECKKYISFYKGYYDQSNFPDALRNWRIAYHICPATTSSNLFLHGENIYRHYLDNNLVSGEAREGMVDTLMRLFDERAAAHPKTKVDQINRKALDAKMYMDANDPRKYEIYRSSIDQLGNFSDPQVLFFYMETTFDKYAAGELDAEKVISTYDELMTLLDGIQVNYDKELAGLSPSVKNYAKYKADYERILASVAPSKKDIEELFIASRVASCDNLVELFTPRYEANPDDMELVEKIVTMLDNADGCGNSDLYFNAATALYAAKPSYKSAYSLYKLNKERENASEAIKYLEEAIASEDSDDALDARYLYELAFYCNNLNRSAKAIEAANRVIRLESDLEEKNYTGKAYMLIGRIWAGTSCGGNEIDRVAKYWVAVDYLQRARAVDSSIAEDCGRYIAAYSAQFPQAVDAANYDIVAGQSYTVSCGGMSASTVVRTRL